MTGTPGPRNGRVRVLIVDDEPALTDVLSVAVEEAGWRAYPALDGQSALRIARGCPPHAVVLDGMLPDLDGLQVLRRLRACEQTPACAAASGTHARRVAEPPTWLRHEGAPAPCDRTLPHARTTSRGGTPTTPRRPPFGRTTGVCSQALRHENPKPPVLMLTARDALEHRLDGLGAGADDYVTKLFSLEEVVLRLRGLLRRAGAERARSDTSVRVLGDLVLTEESREVHRAGVPVPLTAKEFDLLSLMMGHPRQVLSKARILDHVWSSSFDGGGNLVEVYISNLRRKIDHGRAPLIHTVRGLGYGIRPVEDGT
ncbi:response regulator transcription factor [Streptomyces sp. NPDC048581]|uniref:response regulator transcription factor n=1 Tax=unclassified Streptomyces TaxID=2593676 RepID=UPI003724866E